MKAIRIHETGEPDQLRYQDIPLPEPGASEVFTQGLRFRPSARALRATRPAPIIT